MSADVRALGGIIASLVTNFDETGRLDPSAITANVDYVVANGVHGVCVAGGTGEGITLSSDEYRRAVAAAIEGAAGRALVVAGALHADPLRVIDDCRVAEELGADAAMIMPPYFASPSQRQARLHVGSIAQKVGLPLILFNAQNRSGVWLDVQTIVAIAGENDNVVGLKDSSRNLVAIGELVNQLGPAFRIFQGADTLIVPTLAMGGVGAINSLAMLFPRLFVELYEAFLAGDIARARELQLKVLPLANAVYEETNPVGLKYALDILGRRGGPCRPPLHPISDQAATRLRAFLAGLEAMPDLAATSANEARA